MNIADDDIIGICRGNKEALVAVINNIDLMIFLFEPALNQMLDSPVIFEEKDAHMFHIVISGIREKQDNKNLLLFLASVV